MNYFVAAATFVGLGALPVAALADGGSRQAAGGGFMSSYVNDPYHDPRSLHSQRNGTGQILGQPMLSESAGVHSAQRTIGVSRQQMGEPHWAAGTTRRRAR